MGLDVSAWYDAFARREVRGQSPTYERLARAVAADLHVLALLDQLPEPKRQPNLFFAAARHLGAPLADPAGFLAWVAEHWEGVAQTMRDRRTQTNEVGRCATLLPVLAGLPQPLALLEVGCSAGLCLYPDAYRYRYGDHLVGSPTSAVELACQPSGPVPLPERLPNVVWRAGLDLNPLDVRDDDDLRWLEALVWPEQSGRLARLWAAAGIARRD
ncbi:MAG TPA: DUF2332 domain-containing protein, partial [Micromonosporaceae bacterium]